MVAPVDDETLIDLLEKARESGDPEHDITTSAPGLTAADGYRLQIGYKKRLARKGDAHIGYRISMTSRAGMAEAAVLGLISQEMAAGPPMPVFTGLSASNLADTNNVVRRRPGRYLYAEGEVVLLIDKPLAGPAVTTVTARAAIGVLYAGLDMAQIAKERRFSWPHTLASTCSPADTTIVLGTHAIPASLDLRTEGILISVDGQERSSATAWETLGGPLNCLVWLANELAKYGERLEPGQIVVTGVCAYPQRIRPEERLACAEFTRLGAVAAVIAD
jgi:2-keto-4-pentenoate hydratase